MKKLGLLLLPILAITLMLGGNAFAQDNSVYFTTYYSNANTTGATVGESNSLWAPDATVRIINDGNTDAGLYADIYVFDDSQELQACCGCFVSADGLLSESVNKELTNNSLTGKVNTRGVIKVISDSNIKGWNAGSASVPKAGLRVVATHIQAGFEGGFAVTETNAFDSNLGTVEKSLLPQECGFIVGTQTGGNGGLGSGKGTCSCTPEDSDF
jgi:hypothetical protein